jgi:hypothetical protein
MPSLRQYLLPHRLREVLACCPASFQTYAAFHLDTIRKILNHLLALLITSCLFLFFSSWGAALGPSSSGLKVVSISLLLLLQAIAVYTIVNNQPGGSRRILMPLGSPDGSSGGILGALVPTDFMLGVALGITVGGSILAFVLSSTFSRPPWPCDGYNYSSTLRSGASSHQNQLAGNQTSSGPPPGEDPSGTTTDSVNYRCHQLYLQGGGSALYVWFWSSLVFWFNFCASLLLAAGRRDLSLTSSYSYEHIGGVDDAAPGGGTFPGDMAQSPYPPGGPPQSVTTSPSPSFVGDYARIPEIRTDAGEPGATASAVNGGASPGASPSMPSSEKSRIVVSL